MGQREPECTKGVGTQQNSLMKNEGSHWDVWGTSAGFSVIQLSKGGTMTQRKKQKL